MKNIMMSLPPGDPSIQCSEEDVGLLDLLYHQKYGTGEWSIYKMYGRIGTVKQLSGDTLQDVIKKSFQALQSDGCCQPLQRCIMESNYDINLQQPA